MNAHQYFTLEDEERGFMVTKAALKAYDLNDLIHEYRASMRDCFGCNVFCGSARKWFNLVVFELLDRGTTEYETIFGKSPITYWPD